MVNPIAIALHGGAGTIVQSQISPQQEGAYKAALKYALDAGYKALKSGKSATDAVEIAVIELENTPLFNAGKGAVFTAEGTNEMDASIMEGKDRNAGAVAMVQGVKNPISLARLVMEKSGHVFLAGKGAEEFARKMNCFFESPDYFYDDFRYRQWQQVKGSDSFQLDHSAEKEQKFGTVGAVALDQYGNLAAATSTGGMTNKQFGRVGDSPMIGAGNYANNRTCAVSCTGSGEYFIRAVVAYDVSCLMEFRGLSLEAAADETINKRLIEIGGDGGLVAIDGKGNIAMPFNTEGMYRAFKHSDGREVVSIYRV